MPTTPSQASLKVTKSTEYKGGTKLWSNRYFLNQTSIDTSAHFNTLADAVVAAEKLSLGTWTTITEVTGYNGGSELPVYTRTYTTVGTYAKGTDQIPPLEVSALIRYSTTQRTSKNHPLYLFNYVRGACQSSSSNHEAVPGAYMTVLQTYANAWVAGFSDGVTTYKRAGPHGAVAQGAFVHDELTHRDFRD
jgi:hypothetical protein